MKEKLTISEEGRRVMVLGFLAGRTSEFIAQAVKDATREKVSERTVARRAAEWRIEVAERRARREHVADLVGAMKASGMDGSEMIQALACDQLMEHPEALTGADPIELHGLQLKAETIRQKARELDIRARVVAMDERRLGMLEEREKRAVELLRPEAAMTPEERVDEIRRIYGLSVQRAS